ncbi:MAG: type I-C CRISPR-associated protein Cas8c/Csd1, partial [Deltaproteobacteria bacterium]|nr:type I-C CRISPR-associated protein Cas8c/Csd1 [Deltaproteobacteria bacterium]
MLELLLKYGRGHGLGAEPGFSPKSIRWAIVCQAGGRFLDVVELGDAGQKRNPGRLFKCPNLSQPEMKAGGVTKSHFLADGAEVVALLGHKENNPKLEAKHAYFIDLLKQASRAAPQLAGLAQTLADPASVEAIRERLADQGARPTDKVTFQVGGQFPLEADDWRGWWQAFRQSLTRDKQKLSRPMLDLATGQLVEPVKTHPKIKGLTDVGGISSGDVLIGFKQDSFWSYGLDQSWNAAVCEQSAAEYAEALNALIRDHGKRLAGAKVVYWYKETIPPEDDPLAVLDEGSPEQEEMTAL